MPRLSLLGGTYQAQSVIANYQQCLNLYPEINPPSSGPPVSVTHYYTPGLTLFATAPNNALIRGMYRPGNVTDLYVCAGDNIYYVDMAGNFTLVHTVTTTGLTTPVYFADNGVNIMMTDGTIYAYIIGVASRLYVATISTAQNYLGSYRTEYLDTYFLCSEVNFTEMFISDSAAYTFTALNFAAKSGYSDDIQACIALHREIWLIGSLTTEVWYNAGAADFPYQALPGAFIQHGAVGPYAIAKQDQSVYWLSQDSQGISIVLEGNGYNAKRISNHSIEYLIQSQISNLFDAIGFCYQQFGHTFYFLTFPGNDLTLVYDSATEQWHQRAYLNPGTGLLERHRANCYCATYDRNFVGDYANGNIYYFDPTNGTDNGDPIQRVRGFPHVINEDKRILYTKFVADMAPTSSNLDVLTLDWSDNRGISFGTPVTQPMGSDPLTSIQWRRLGLARDRVFRLTWITSNLSALNGAFIEYEVANS